MSDYMLDLKRKLVGYQMLLIEQLQKLWNVWGPHISIKIINIANINLSKLCIILVARGAHRILVHGTQTEESCAAIECATRNQSGSSSFTVNVDKPSIDVNRSEWCMAVGQCDNRCGRFWLWLTWRSTWTASLCQGGVGKDVNQARQFLLPTDRRCCGIVFNTVEIPLSFLLKWT